MGDSDPMYMKSLRETRPIATSRAQQRLLLTTTPNNNDSQHLRFFLTTSVISVCSGLQMSPMQSRGSLDRRLPAARRQKRRIARWQSSRALFRRRQNSFADSRRHRRRPRGSAFDDRRQILRIAQKRLSNHCQRSQVVIQI